MTKMYPDFHEQHNEDGGSSSSTTEVEYRTQYPPAPPSPTDDTPRHDRAPPRYQDSVTDKETEHNVPPARPLRPADSVASSSGAVTNEPTARIRMETVTTISKVSQQTKPLEHEKREYKEECLNALWVYGGFMWIEIVLIHLFAFVYFISIIGIPIGLDLLRYIHLIQTVSYSDTRITHIQRDRYSDTVIRAVKTFFWLPFGLITALFHVAFGVILCLIVVGIPYGLKHFRLIETSFIPFDLELAKPVKVVRDTNSWATDC